MSRKANGQKTKELIALAVYQLMHKMPYDEISVKDICNKAGVSRMSFYRYYDKKDDVFIDYCDEKFAEFFDEFYKRKDPSLKDFIEAVFEYIKVNAKQLLILKRARREQLLVTQFDSYACYAITKIKFNHIKEIKNTPLFGSFISGGVFNVLMKWVDGGMKESPKEMTDYIFSIFEK